MKTKEIFNKIIKAIGKLLLLSVSGKFKKQLNAESETNATNKTWLNWLKDRFKPRQKQQINYNFNMENFFTLNGKIEENRRFLRETQDKYEKIRSYYPLFFIYIGMLSVYSFDILTYILTTTFTGSVFFLSSLFLVHILLFIYVFYLFTKVLILKNIAVDPLPKLVYGDYDKEKIVIVDTMSEKEKNKNENYNKDLSDRELQYYLNGLEEDTKLNFELSQEKKKILAKVIKLCLYSFALYIVLITFYKINSMSKTEPPKDKVEINKTTDGLTRKQQQFIADSTIKAGDLLIEKTNKETQDTIEEIKKNFLGIHSKIK